MPSQGEDHLDHHRAFEQPGIGEADHRDQRHQDRPEGMAPDHQPLDTPFAGGGDIFLRELLQHEGARHARAI